MNPFKKSIIGSVLILTSFIKYYKEPEIFSSARIFLFLGYIALYFEFGNDNFKPKSANEEEEWMKKYLFIVSFVKDISSYNYLIWSL